MEEKIRILQLAPRYPFPEDDGGKIGIANITKEFSRLGCEVTFFCFAENEISIEHKKLIEPYAELITYKHSTRNTADRIAKSIFKKNSLYISKHSSGDILKFLEELTFKKKFDVIHADHSCMAPLALHLKNKFGIPAGLRLHNIEWIIWQRYADIHPRYNLKRCYIQSQSNKLKSDEKNIFQHIDIAFAITNEDKSRALELNPEMNVRVATAGVQMQEWNPDDTIERDKYELILATTYHWRHNRDAIKWFIENVMIELSAKIPNIKLSLIGTKPPKWLHNYTSTGVNVIGYVDKVQPYLNKAGIYISPLFVGGGIRIKILEAMAMKLPVLASPVAAEGINAGSDDGLILCKNKDEFIASVAMLINDDQYRQRLGENAMKFILENHSWEKNVKIMVNEYKSLLNN